MLDGQNSSKKMCLFTLHLMQQKIKLQFNFIETNRINKG